jgi:hypothetical protein
LEVANELCRRVLTGDLAPALLARMTSEEMAPPEVIAQRHEWARIGGCNAGLEV